MPRGRGQANLNWPFSWLRGGPQPGAFDVPVSVTPTLDVGQHSTELRLYREQFTMVAGVNQIFLPGFNRVSQLNGAVPTPRTLAARRWMSLNAATDTALVAGEDVSCTMNDGANSSILTRIEGDVLYPNGLIMPLIRCRASVTLAGDPVLFNGYPTSVYVPDPIILVISILNQAGGELITVSGLFIEADTVDRPLPDLFS